MMKYFILLSAVIIMVSCSATKKVQQTLPAKTDTASAPAEPETAASVISKLNKIDFTTFSGKVNVDYASAKDSRSVNVKLVMKKDEAIWLSAGLLGIEGVRVLITKDSVQILNKLNKEYTATSLSYLQDKIGLPVNFATLQDLLIGNAVFIDAQNSTLAIAEGKPVLTSTTEHFTNILRILMPGYLPSTSSLTDVDSTKNRSAELAYSDYKPVDGRNFPITREVNVKHKNTVRIKMEFDSYVFNGDVSTPFSVPAGYKRVTPK